MNVIKKLSENQKEGAAKNIYESAQKIEFFQNNIKTLHKLAKPSYNLNKTRLGLTDLLIKRISICQKFYDPNNERFFEFDIQDNVIANLDEYYIKQVFDNLILNAITYCQNGNIKISLKLKKDNIEFFISDNGIGIPYIELEKIFNEFVVSSRTESSAGGRGIGLTVCKRIIKAHGGKICAESNDRTTLMFIIPIGYNV